MLPYIKQNNMYLRGLAVNCLAVKWTGCQMSHGQLSGGHTSRGQMVAVKCRGPSWMATLKSDLSLHNLTFEDAIELALDKSLWRLLVASGATH